MEWELYQRGEKMFQLRIFLQVELFMEREGDHILRREKGNKYHTLFLGDDYTIIIDEAGFFTWHEKTVHVAEDANTHTVGENLVAILDKTKHILDTWVLNNVKMLL